MPAHAAPMPLAHRYFFALLPDVVTARRIHAFAERELGAKGLQAAARLHVTLGITEDFATPNQPVLEALQRAGAAVAAAPFEIALDQLSGSHRTLALRPAHSLPPLRMLQLEIADAMARERIAMRADWRFNPHLTLIYRDGALINRAIDAFAWPVSDFVLLESLVGLGQHVVRGRWPLHVRSERQGTLFPD